MKFTFKVGESLKKSWSLYKDNFNSMIVLVLITFAIQLLSQIISRSNKNILLVIVLAVINIFISYLWIKATINLLDNKGFNPFSKDVTPNFPQIWDFFKTGVLIFLCVLPIIIISGIGFGTAFYGIFLGNFYMIIIGVILFLLLLIPAIYVSSRLFTAKYLSVEKCQGARNSIAESWRMTKGNGWVIVWKMMIIGLFMGLGFVAFFVGTIITYPVGMISLVSMYRELVKQNSGDVVVTVVENTNPVSSKSPTQEEKKEEVIPEENK